MEITPPLPPIYASVDQPALLVVFVLMSLVLEVKETEKHYRDHKPRRRLRCAVDQNHTFKATNFTGYISQV